MTTAISKNMRTTEEGTGRLRTTQRSGYKKYNAFPILKNYMAFSEDPTKNNQENTPASEGWGVNRKGNLVTAKDGTLGPDGVSEAFFVKQVVGVSEVAWVYQYFDTRSSSEGAQSNAHPGADVFLTSDNTVVFSVFMKALDPRGSRITTASRIILRQDSSSIGNDGKPIQSLTVSWSTAGVPTFSSEVTFTGSSYAILDEGNDWWRLYVQMTWDTSSESTHPLLYAQIVPFNTGIANVKEVGAYVWGAQLETDITVPTTYHSVQGRNDLEASRKTQALVALNHANRWLRHEELDKLEPERESVRTPLKRAAVRIEQDAFGDYYVIDGPSSVSKYNSAWKEIFQIDIPTEDEAHRCEALHIDVLGCIYVAVTAGGDQGTAKMWKYRQGPSVGISGDVAEESYHLAWEVETGAYVVDLAVNEAELLVCQNYDDYGYGEVVVYNAIDSSAPNVDRRIETTHPQHGMTVKPDGSFLVTAPSASPRGLNPNEPALRATATGWTPKDFEQYDEHAHVWLDSRRINGIGTKTEDSFEEDGEVVKWFDLTSNDRNLRVPKAKEPPTVRLHGLGRHPTVHFNGTDMGMQTFENPSSDVSSKTEQRTLMPGISSDNAFTMFVVYRPAYSVEIDIASAAWTESTLTITLANAFSEYEYAADDIFRAVSGTNVVADDYTIASKVDDDSITLTATLASPTGDTTVTGTLHSAANQGCVIGQRNCTDSKPINDAYRVLCANRDSGQTIVNPTDGYVTFYDHADVGNTGQGNDDHPEGFNLSGGTGELNCCVSTIKNNLTNSITRHNGTAGTEYDSKATRGTQGTSVGYFSEEGKFGHFRGEICEILVYDIALTDFDIEMHEGYFANRWGFQGRLATDHRHYASSSSVIQSAAPKLPDKPDINLLNHSSTILAKYSRSGDLVWALSDYSGVGYDVTHNDEGDLYTIGEHLGRPLSLGEDTGYTWTEATRLLEDGGGGGYFASANYTFQAGDTLEITSGTGARLGHYRIESVDSDDGVILEQSIGILADGETDIVFSDVFRGRQPGSLDGHAYIRKVLDNGDTADPISGPVAAPTANMVHFGAVREFDESDFWAITQTAAVDDITVSSDDPGTEAPDGNQTADKLTAVVASDDGAAHQLMVHSWPADELIPDEDYCFSIYIKTDDALSSSLYLKMNAASPASDSRATFTYASGNFDLSNSTTGEGLHFGDYEVLKDGWFRVWVTLTYDPSLTSADGTMKIQLEPDSSGSATLRACYVWGAQMERGTEPSPLTEGILPPWRDFRPRLAVDSFSNVYAAYSLQDGTTTDAASEFVNPLHSFRLFDKDLVHKSTIRLGDRELGTMRPGRDVAPNQFPPEYVENEPGVTRNISLFTERFSVGTGYYTHLTVSHTDDASVAPDGKVTADSVVASAVSSYVGKTGATAFTANEITGDQTYTYSIHVKTVDSDQTALLLTNSLSSQTLLEIDWTTDPPMATRSDTGSVDHAHFIEKSDNGFWRIGVSLGVSSSLNSGSLVMFLFPDNLNGSGEVYIWGAQLEGGMPASLSDYQGTPGSSPFPPVARDTIEVADTTALASEALPIRTEDFSDTNVWDAGSATLTADQAVDPLGFGTFADELSMTPGNTTIIRTITPTDLEGGELILQHGKNYRFQCYVGHLGGALESAFYGLEIRSSSSTVKTNILITHSIGLETPDEAGDGTHEVKVTRIPKLTSTAQDWYLLDVSMTYDKTVDDGNIECEIYGDASGATRTMYIWGARFFPEAGFTSVHSQPLVKETPTGLAPRETKLLAVSLGCVLNVTPYSRSEILRGGSSALDQKARYVSTTTLYQKLFATDGSRAITYDPVKSGIVEPFKADKGEVPKRAQLVSNWRGRLVMARTTEDPHAWFMSALEDPFDWDYFTPPLSSAKAIFAGSSRAGRAPDLINSLCPYDDQQLIIGCDHALWYLPGDPYSGAQWQLLSDVTGMHYGNHTWCKDPQGWIYFFGARGGFYRMAPGGRPERMTENTIERRLSDLDLDQYYVELHWNWRAEGIHIFVIPFGGGGTVVKHYFWGRRFDEWREDEFGSADNQPTAAVVLDGDKASDRRLLLASEDLHVLKWDEDTYNDDGTAIDSKELLGPYRPPFDQIARWSQFEAVLSEASSDITYTLYDSTTPETLGAAKATGTLSSGRNPRKLSRARGANLWIELSNSTAGESWSFEEGTFHVSPAGRSRV